MHINHPSAFFVVAKYEHKNNEYYDFSKEKRPHHNLLFMLNGSAVISSEGTTFTVSAGEICYIPKGSTYTAKWICSPTCEYKTVHFNVLQKDEPFENKKVCVQKINSSFFKSFFELVKDIKTFQDAPPPASFKALSAFYNLIAELFPLVQCADSEIKPSQITPALNFLENNLLASVKVEDLAKLCFLSPSRFFFVFKEQVGCSPIVYKNQMIIQRASQTLLFEKNKSIEEISNQYGFDTPIYFRRIFKQITGKTPTEYRKNGGFI
ncbi:MAG: AraC family transcriptional regulator [Clostridia bacterium]|nr:AraC family transcriptional regulator [Clostridia bacterium]